jgi:hypothetical protein
VVRNETITDEKRNVQNLETYLTSDTLMYGYRNYGHRNVICVALWNSYPYNHQSACCTAESLLFLRNNSDASTNSLGKVVHRFRFRRVIEAAVHYAYS